jgi:hypothetical protein
MGGVFERVFGWVFLPSGGSVGQDWVLVWYKFGWFILAIYINVSCPFFGVIRLST